MPDKKNLPFYLSIETGGNLVLFDCLGKALWSTNTNLNLANPMLAIDNDGALRLWDSYGIYQGGKVYWTGYSGEFGINLCTNSVNTLVCKTGKQDWTLANFLDGYSTLQNKLNGLYLTDTGSSVTLKVMDRSASQDWKITDTQIINRATNKVLKLV